MKDFIEVFDNALSSDECKMIIDFFERDGGDPYTDIHKKEDRECNTLSMYLNRKEFSPCNTLISKALNQYTPKYIEMHPELQDITPWGPFYGCNIQKYLPNQCYWKSHTENDGVMFMRCGVWTIYLNTVTDGGGTTFTQHYKTIDAVEGRLVIWPAYWTHFHKGVVSKTQTKYIATGWYVHKHLEHIKPLAKGAVQFGTDNEI